MVLEGAQSISGGAHAERLVPVERERVVVDWAAVVLDLSQSMHNLLESGRDAHDGAGGRIGRVKRGRLDEELEQLNAQRLDLLGVAAGCERQPKFGHEVLTLDARLGQRIIDTRHRTSRRTICRSRRRG